MFLRRVHILLVIIGFSLVLLNCGGYEKLLKSNDYKLKYTKAMEYYHAEEYVRAATLFDQIAPIYRGTIKADTVFYFQAKSYYMQRDYILAGHHFGQLAINYPNSVYAEESDYMSAYCYYKTSPKPSLDQGNTIKSINALTLFMIKYPQSSRVVEARILIDEMRNKLVEKSYNSAKVYYNMGEYKASIIALKNSLTAFPDTKYREELLYLTVRSSFLLAENSIPSKQKERYQNTMDEYYTFIGEFPESKYKKEAERIYNEAVSFAGSTTQIE